MARPRHLLRLVMALGLALGVMSFPASAAESLAGYKKAVIKRQYKTSAARLRELAENGNAEAQYRLGAMYRLGLGVPADMAVAEQWLRRAAARGHRDAATLLARLQLVTVPPTTFVPPAAAPVAFVPPVAPDAREGKGPTWLMRAAARGQLPAIAAFSRTAGALEDETAAGETALILASSAGRHEAASLLIAAGADANHRDRLGRTALAAALAQGRAAAAALIGGGADATVQDQSGVTPLLRAAASCNRDGIAQLLGRRVPPAADSQGQTPLHRAVKSCTDRQVIDALAAVQDVDARDRWGRTALWYAAALGRGDAAIVLLAGGGAAAASDSDGLAPLHMAIIRNHPAMARLLIAGGAPSDLRTARGDTPLMLAVSARCADCAADLLASGSAADEQNALGDSALIFATRNHDVDLAKRLLAAGADPHQRNKRRETPVLIAERSGARDLAQLFQAQ